MRSKSEQGRNPLEHPSLEDGRQQGLNFPMKPAWMLGFRGGGVRLFPTLFPTIRFTSCSLPLSRSWTMAKWSLLRRTP